MQKNKNEKIKLPGRRAREITQSYIRDFKFKKLDRLFAADIVGDGTAGGVVVP